MEKKFYYPPEGWKIHKANLEWYQEMWRDNDTPHPICSLINSLKLSSKPCCSPEIKYPNEEEQKKIGIDEIERVRFVDGFDENHPSRWGIEIIHLETFKKEGQPAYLYFAIMPGPEAKYHQGAREDDHRIALDSEDAKQKFLKWFNNFCNEHGFVEWRDFPIQERSVLLSVEEKPWGKLYHYKHDWIDRKGNIVNPPQPEKREAIIPLDTQVCLAWKRGGHVYQGVTFRSLLRSYYRDFGKVEDKIEGLVVEYEVNDEFLEFVEFCERMRVARSTFTFDVETVLKELATDPKWSEKVEAYRMYQRGMFQDDIKKHFGVTQSAISKWISKVKGELSRRMGAAYERFRKAKLELRPDVDHVIYDGRQGKPDFVVYLKDGSVEVISSKCYYSDRKSVSIKRAEIEPEIQEALRLRAEGRQVRLYVDFYNLHDKHHEMREIPLDKIPPRLLFQHT